MAEEEGKAVLGFATGVRGINEAQFCQSRTKDIQLNAAAVGSNLVVRHGLRKRSLARSPPVHGDALEIKRLATVINRLMANGSLRSLQHNHTGAELATEGTTRMDRVLHEFELSSLSCKLHLGPAQDANT
eukprot:8054837-Pyramimonas_sp.AAC.1